VGLSIPATAGPILRHEGTFQTRTIRTGNWKAKSCSVHTIADDDDDNDDE
jgi:hypothetical protein